MSKVGEIRDLLQRRGVQVNLKTFPLNASWEESQLEQISLEGISANSQEIMAGMVFAALPGLKNHGAQFASAAVAQGACAVLTDEVGLTILSNLADNTPGVQERESTDPIPVILVDNPLRYLGEVAAAIYDHPFASMRTFAITGTNGKTTTAFMLEQILASAGATPGLIGTVAVRVGEHSVPATLTTPMPADFQRIGAQMRERGASDLVMEVSSHALAQRRTDPVHFSVAGFTNLTQDHLDYHHTLQEYFYAKASLFNSSRCERAVILVDDEWGTQLYRDNSDHATALAFDSLIPSGSTGWQAHSEGDILTLTHTDGTQIHVRVGLPGHFNLANAALALAMAWEGGVRSFPQVIAPQVPGRMEVVNQRPRVVVDFAHNTDALVQAMVALSPVSRSDGECSATQGRLIVLSGAAGERDREKRPAMGAALARGGDVVIITDDDPHAEDPALIRHALLEGAHEATVAGARAEILEVPDRYEAISRAVEIARASDTILLAGRGHETHQDRGSELVELDDREAARRALLAYGKKDT